ncbi:MAG: DUF362 domain-containing protein [Candidatus Bathyarchaeota archaeon]|nr:MAG: DUF362 domain-containing protein [Candidatus Bathyarchaeota archaeon]
MAEVAIVKGTYPVEVTVKALGMIDVDEVLSEEKPVLIKPNYINANHPSTGITTDSRVIEGVVKFLKNRGVKDVLIGEGSGFGDTFKAFRVAGVDKVAKRWNVGLINLNKDDFVEVSPPNPLALKRAKIAKTVLESTIISVPKLKLHRMTEVTLSIKNMMGAVTPKGSMHTSLNEKIADLASTIKPSIAVVDGIIASEGHETSGNSLEMNLVIAGTDPVAVDAVGAAVMGVSPKNVKHLRLAEKKGIGTCDLERIKIVGEPIERVRKKFRRSLSSRVLRYLA